MGKKDTDEAAGEPGAALSLGGCCTSMQLPIGSLMALRPNRLHTFLPFCAPARLTHRTSSISSSSTVNAGSPAPGSPAALAMQPIISSQEPPRPGDPEERGGAAVGCRWVKAKAGVARKGLQAGLRLAPPCPARDDALEGAVRDCAVRRRGPGK